MKIKIAIIAMLAILAFTIISGFYIVHLQPIFERWDRNANFAFYDKAKKLNIVGKSKEFVRNNFGSPKYIYYVFYYVYGDSEIWEYEPGPFLARFLAFWNSYCKIGFDKKIWFYEPDPFLGFDEEIWIYEPGPFLAFWNSCCKIGFDKKTNLVDGFMVNSD